MELQQENQNAFASTKALYIIKQNGNDTMLKIGKTTNSPAGLLYHFKPRFHPYGYLILRYWDNELLHDLEQVILNHGVLTPYRIRSPTRDSEWFTASLELVEQVISEVLRTAVTKQQQPWIKQLTLALPESTDATEPISVTLPTGIVNTRRAPRPAGFWCYKELTPEFLSSIPNEDLAEMIQSCHNSARNHGAKNRTEQHKISMKNYQLMTDERINRRRALQYGVNM